MSVPQSAKTQQSQAVAGGTYKDDRPRSGYARKNRALMLLSAEHAALKAEHERLQRTHEALKVGHEELQAALSELLEIHNGLLADLRQSHRTRSVASDLPGFNLMGRHG
jgi:hypothetical protein